MLKKISNWFFRKDKVLMLIIFAGIGIRFFYLSYTDYNIRSYDTDGHIEYIKYVAEKFQIPIGMQIISFFSYGPFLFGSSPNFKVLSFGMLAIILIASADLFLDLYPNKR